MVFACCWLSGVGRRDWRVGFRFAARLGIVGGFGFG